MKAAIFGDIGGHGEQFFTALKSLGVDIDNGVIPKDLCIIQLGDLIHKGPMSNELVALVDKLMKANPGQWIQLLGNHEMQHLGGFDFWRCDCTLESVKTMRQWWKDGSAVTIAGIKHDPLARRLKSDTSLLSHAGVVHNVWKRGGSSDFVTNGLALQGMQRNDFQELNRPGTMLTGMNPNPNAGFIWAHSTQEVYPSWLEFSMEFNQLHGHTAPFQWERNAWFPGTALKWRKEMNAYANERTATLTPNAHSKGNFAALDPGFELNEPSIKTVPFLLVENFSRLF